MSGFSRTTALRLRNGLMSPLNCSRRSRRPRLLINQAARPDSGKLRIADQARSRATEFQAGRDFLQSGGESFYLLLLRGKFSLDWPLLAPELLGMQSVFIEANSVSQWKVQKVRTEPDRVSR